MALRAPEKAVESPVRTEDVTPLLKALSTPWKTAQVTAWSIH
jgi:hypothetical protein